MGGRGASSGMSVGGRKYGTEYNTLYQYKNIKFIQSVDGTASIPIETMTKRRVYVSINEMNEIKSIGFYDKNNKRYKQIDVKGKPHYINGEKVLPHVHSGYYHNENGDDNVSTIDKKLIEHVKKIWYNR